MASKVYDQFLQSTWKADYDLDTADVRDAIWWENNLKISEVNFAKLLEKALAYLKDKELFVFEGFAGADTGHTLPVRVINEYAWQNIFVQQLFLRSSDTGWTFPNMIKVSSLNWGGGQAPGPHPLGMGNLEGSTKATFDISSQTVFIYFKLSKFGTIEI